MHFAIFVRNAPKIKSACNIKDVTELRATVKLLENWFRKSLQAYLSGNVNVLVRTPPISFL
jgi:hypothetical protein